jgi:hypothetical protein
MRITAEWLHGVGRPFSLPVVSYFVYNFRSSTLGYEPEQLSRYKEYATGSTVRFSNSGRFRKFLLSFTNRPDRPCGLRSLLFVRYWGYIPRIMWPGRDVDHSTPCSPS